MMHVRTRRSARAPTLRRWRWVVAVLGGLLLGPLDLWGQVNTPYPLAHLFNSPAVWAAAAFAYGRWVRELPAAAVGAAIVLVVGVEAYYLTDVFVRDASRASLTSTTTLAWLAAGVLAGLAVGVAGSWAAETAGRRAVLGRAALPAILGAETVHNLNRLVSETADQRPEDLGQFAGLLAVLSVAALAATTRTADRSTTVRAMAATAVAAATFGTTAGTIL